LDIATGIGELVVTAAEVVGDSTTTTTTTTNGGDSHILAIDISPQMLAIAKKRSVF
jgi:ubiquinone/menaquinone biosynthesis C-methylase UbiE